MPFPESARVVFARNPLREVICQLRFPTILELGAREPVDFQNAIRMAFPFYDADSGIALPGDLPAEVTKLIRGGLLGSQAAKVHRFSSADRTRVASLTKDFVAFASTRYTRWDEFAADLAEVRTAFERSYQTPFYTRVGLRYRNVIVREALGKADRPWPQLLRPDLLGILARPEVREEVDRTASDSVLLLQDPPGARVRIRHGLVEDDEAGEAGPALVYLIDSDFFLEGQLDPANVDHYLTSFHSQAGNLFRWFLQEELSDALNDGSAGVP